MCTVGLQPLKSMHCGCRAPSLQATSSPSGLRLAPAKGRSTGCRPGALPRRAHMRGLPKGSRYQIFEASGLKNAIWRYDLWSQRPEIFGT